VSASGLPKTTLLRIESTSVTAARPGSIVQAVTALTVEEKIGSCILTVIDEPRVTEGAFTVTCTTICQI